MPNNNLPELEIPASGFSVFKRAFLGIRGLNAIAHAQAKHLWAAGIGLLAIACIVVFVGSFGIKMFLPDLKAQSSLLAIPLAWVLISMPAFLLFQIIGGKRGLMPEQLFLGAALSCLGFSTAFAAAIFLIQFLPDIPQLTVASFFLILVGTSWAAVSNSKVFLSFLGIADGKTNLLAAITAALATFFAIGLWQWWFESLIKWDPSYFLY